MIQEVLLAPVAVLLFWCVLMTLITVWSRKDTWMRGTVIVMCLLSLPVLAYTSIEMLGWHKPIEYAWRLDDEVRVRDAKLVEDEAIYLYVEQVGEPRAISLDWDQELADQITQAGRASRDNGEQGFMLMFDRSLDVEGMNHPLPQPIVPAPKGAQADMPVYER